MILEGYVKDVPITIFQDPVEEERNVKLVIEGDENYISYKDGETEYIYDKHTYDLYQVINDEKILIVESDVPLNEKQTTLFALTRFGTCATIFLKNPDVEKEQTITDILNYEVEQESGKYEGLAYVMSTTFLTDRITDRVLKVDLFDGRDSLLSCEATRYESTQIDNSRYNNLENGTPKVEIKINKSEWYSESIREQFMINDVMFPEDAQIIINKVETGINSIDESTYHQYTIFGTLDNGIDTFKKLSEVFYDRGYQYVLYPTTHKQFNELLTDYDTSITFIGNATENMGAQIAFSEHANSFLVQLYIAIPNN